MKTILQLCADTGSDTKPYADAGYNVILIGQSIGVENYHPPKNVHGVIANPVCTEFSIATGRDKQLNHEAGLFLVAECLRVISECNPVFWAIENPATGHLKNYLGSPTLTYEPWHYGSPWSKRTALWGEFNIPIKLYKRWSDVPKLSALYVRPGRSKPAMASMHKNAAKSIPEFSAFQPSTDMEFRSLCSQKFAEAFFKANP